MKSPSVHFAILLFLSSWHNSNAKQTWFGGKNQNNNNNPVQSHPRRRLTDVTQEAVDVDAATGTVKLDDPISRCDGQLAQALVAANDAEFQAKQQRDEALQGKAAALEEIRQLQLTIQKLQTTVTQLEVKNKEKENVVQEAVQKGTRDLKALLITKDEMIATLESKLEATKRDVDQQIEAKLAQTIADIRARELELSAQLEQERTAAEELLETTREEAKRVLREHVSAIKEQMKELEMKSKATLSERDETIKQVKAQNERFSKFNQEMLESNRVYEMELKQWRETFESRGYCNMTYISEDIQEMAVNAYSHATHAASLAASKTRETASVAASKASEAALVLAKHVDTHGRKLAKEVAVYARHGYKKSNQIYNDQYNVLWPKIKPQYDQHVAPIVYKVSQWKSKEIDPKLAIVKKEYLTIKSSQIDPRVTVVQTESKKLFAKMVELYGIHCSSSYKSARQLAKEHGFMEHFQKVGPFVKESCDNAELSVNMLLRAMLVFALLPFIGRILGLAWAIVRLVLNIFLTVTLIRFILPRATTISKPVKEQPVPYKAKSNGSGKKRSHRHQ